MTDERCVLEGRTVVAGDWSMLGFADYSKNVSSPVFEVLRRGTLLRKAT
jgi:hypothetical protein